MSTVSTSATISLPESIQKNFLSSKTIGTWKHYIDETLENKGWKTLVTADLKTVIDSARKEEIKRVTHVDPLDESVKSLFALQFDPEEARELVKGEKHQITDTELHERAYITFLDEMRKANKKRLKPDSEEFSKLQTKLNMLTDLWTNRHANLLIAMKASISESMAIQFNHNTTFDLYAAIIKGASVSMATRETNRVALQSIKLGNSETFDSCYSRILWAKYELELSGETVSKIAEFQYVLNALPSTGVRDFSPIKAHYNVLPEDFTEKKIPFVFTLIKEHEAKNAPPSKNDAAPLANNVISTSTNSHRYCWCKVHGWGSHTPEQCFVLQRDPNAAPTRKASTQDPRKPPGSIENSAKVSKLAKEIKELKALIAQAKESTIPAPPVPDGIDKTNWLQAFQAYANKAAQKYSSSNIIIDSACTPVSMSPFVINSDNTPGPPVSLADGSSIPSQGKGTLKIQGLDIKDVLQVNDLDHTLLSVPSLVKTQNKKVTFGETSDSCIITDKLTGESIDIPFDEISWLWKLPPPHTALMTQAQRETNEQWHKRTMFTNNRYLADASKTIHDLPTITQDPTSCTCTGCMAGKGHQLQWNGNGDQYTDVKPGERWDFDIWGPSPVRTPAGNQYLLMGSDYSTGLKVGYLLKKRSEAKDKILLTVAFSETQSENTVKRIHLDRAGEFMDHSLTQHLELKGIQITTATARTKEQNPIAERANRTITEKMRAALWDSKLAHTFWGDVSLAAIHVSNRMPTKRNKGKSPHQVFYGIVPSITHFRRIGCIGWVFVEEQTRKNKLAARAVCCSLIGYSDTSKSYRLVDIYSGKYYESRHVVFDENQTAFDIRNRQTSTPQEIAIRTIATDMTLENFNSIFNDEQEEVIQLESKTSLIPTSNPFSRLYDHNTDSVIDNTEEDHQTKFSSDENSSIHSSISSIQNQPGDETRDNSPPNEFDIDPYDSNLESSDEYHSTTDDLPDVLQPTNQDEIFIDSSGGKFTLEPIENHAPMDITSGPENPTRRPDAKIRNAHVSSLHQNDFLLIPLIANLSQQILDNTNIEHLEYNSTDIPELPASKFSKENSPFVLDGDIITIEDVPTTFSKAMTGPNKKKWENAIAAELMAHEENGTFKEVNAKEKGYIALGCKWVFAYKKANGKIIRFKARLVLQGYRQRYGIDYTHTSSPVVKIESLKLILLLAAIMDLECHSIDVDTAYLYAKMKNLLYAKIPQSYVVKADDTKFLIVKKALYGAKQSGREWYEHLTAFLKTMGYNQLKSDPCVFYNRLPSEELLIICIYVDDLLLVGHSKMLDNFKCAFKAKFKCKDPGPIKEFLNFEVHRNRHDKSILLTQHEYTKQLFITYEKWLQKLRPSNLPGTPNIDLSIRFLPPVTPEESIFLQDFPYREMVGSLQYLTNTRPEISASLGQLNSYVASPRKIHCIELLKIFSYLKSNLHEPIGHHIGSNTTTPLSIIAHSDADWGKDLDTRRSRYGTVLSINNTPIKISSGLQSTVHQATSHAELDAANAGCRDIIFARQFLDELGIPYNQPTLHSDNTGAQAIAENDTLAKGSRHLDIKLFWIRELISKNLLKMEHCPSNEMIADILTKNLPRPLFERFRPLLGVQLLSDFQISRARGGVGTGYTTPIPLSTL